MDYEANRRVETSARTFAIVEQLSGVDRLGVSALADELGMSKGIVHNHLSTLRELGYVRKVADGYQLSPRLLSVGLRARSNAPLYRFGHDLCREFAAQFDTGVLLCQHSDSDCTVVDAHGVPSARDLAVGTTLSLAASLVGAVIRLAADGSLPSETADAYDTDRLRAAFDGDGSVTGRLSTAHEGDCVAVPILGAAGTCHGGVAVLLPEGQSDQRRTRLTEATRSLRDRIERRFDSEWPGERSFATEKHSWVG